ncbi:AraC family transcriptional regulator [Cohnella endophytica]|uniref:AraC family transcriptional regulator n=1 Tax=Cohnella endophytica TaxID=2419778 RepID=A0A494XTZ1_9BACL|nr:AraC family transcriptional regulator [Cohnella endophytica]RKP54048.1 AraC family transcriptional regulator [Cohnella endophytica]
MARFHPDSAYIDDLLRNLRVHLVEAHFTQCSPEWRELNYIPDYNKFYFICEGDGWVKIGGEEFYPVAGQLCLMPAHVEQSYSTISDDPFRKYWCHFIASLGELDLFQWLEVPFCMDIRDNARMLGLFRELVELHKNADFISRIREKAILLELIAHFLTEADPHIRVVPGRAEDVDRLNRIERFIDNRLAEHITLEQLAKHVHLHPNYLVRYFNKHFAVSPLKYLNRKRMQKAKTLLGTTSLSIKEVAELVGYPDTNHFAKAFRKESSFSPTEYRLQAASRLP